MKYLRFVVGHESDDIDTLTGIITEARFLQDDNLLSKKENNLLNKTYKWLNKKLPCPPWSQNNWEYGVSWFKKDAHEFINQMWKIADILKEHGKPVRMLKIDNPGKIVYEDDYQIVAVAWVDVSGSRHHG